ncbi:transcriptional protein SWT1, partial [Arapaima gigas]
RFAYDEDKRKMPKDRTTFLDKSSCNHNPRKEREYKKAVYRLGTASKQDKDKPSMPEAGEKLFEAVGNSTRKNTCKMFCPSEERIHRPTLRGPLVQNSLSEELKQTRNLERRRAVQESNNQNEHYHFPHKGNKAQEQQQCLSEELKLKRLKLVKIRSRALDAERNSLQSQGKSHSDFCRYTSKQSHGFAKTATSEINLNVPKMAKQESVKLAQRSKLSASCQRDKAGYKSSELFSCSPPKDASVEQDRSIIGVQSSSLHNKDHIKPISRSPYEHISSISTSKESIASKSAFSNKRSCIIASSQKGKTPSTTSSITEVTLGEQFQETVKRFPGTEKMTKGAQSFSTLSDQHKICMFVYSVTTTQDAVCVIQMLLVEEIHQARSHKLLEVSVVKSYGELTCMEIDPPEEATTISLNNDHIHEDLLIVLDTNILLSHLDFVKKMKTHGLGALGFPNILIPWVVLQELDALKNGKLSGSAAHKATPAVHYIYMCLKNQEPHLWGQSMQQAAQAVYGLKAENNDDRVLHCCLQYQTLYPGVSLVLCTNDKNLCSKAILCGVRALSKADLVFEVERLKSEGWPQLYQTPCITKLAQSVKDKKENGSEDEEMLAAAEAREVRTCICVLEDALQEALSHVLTTEMQHAYGELWQEIVLVKPPWTLSDLLQCFKKHWIAVFGIIFQRNLLKIIESLGDTLCKGKTMDRCSVQLLVQQAQELLQAFGHRSDYSGHLLRALSYLEPLPHRLCQPNRRTQETPGISTISADGDDTLMAEDSLPDVSSLYQEVWAVFEDIWKNICQISSEVFSGLGFICGSSQVSRPEKKESFPEGAIVCLHKLTITVQQLLHIFERVLSSNCCYEDVESLFTFISASELVAIKPSFTVTDLCECLSQQEYREKMHVGGKQLAHLGQQLERCTSDVAHMSGSSSWT